MEDKGYIIIPDGWLPGEGLQNSFVLKGVGIISSVLASFNSQLLDLLPRVLVGVGSDGIKHI